MPGVPKLSLAQAMAGIATHPPFPSKIKEPGTNGDSHNGLAYTWHDFVLGLVRAELLVGEKQGIAGTSNCLHELAFC